MLRAKNDFTVFKIKIEHLLFEGLVVFNHKKSAP